jgi:hypothetical protein
VEYDWFYLLGLSHSERNAEGQQRFTKEPTSEWQCITEQLSAGGPKAAGKRCSLVP